MTKRMAGLAGVLLLLVMAAGLAVGQTVTTTTVQGTVYEANGAPASGTLLVSWPAFRTAANQAVAAGQTSVVISADGFVSVNLAPNAGASPAGLYYTAVFHLADGTVHTEYWVVPAAASATLAQVEAQVMPAAQAVQSVSKTYVDGAIAALQGSLLTASGGTLTGPLTLNGDPTTPLMAADKHYVDQQVAGAVPLAGGTMTGGLAAPAVNGVLSPVSGGAQSTLQATVTAAGTTGAMVVPPSYAGTDTFTNGNGVRVEDLRATGAQQHERSVKEFGAVCNGVVDDTAALQAAINYANANGVALTLPAGVCKTQQLVWHGESIGGQGAQVSVLMGAPGQDVLAAPTDATGMLSRTRLHDLTILVDQSLDVSCTGAQGRAAAGSCGVNRPVEAGSIFSPGGNGLTGTAGTGAGWYAGNCAIAMPASLGTGGNGLRQAVVENVVVGTVGADPLASYAQADSTHTCGLYLGQWPVQTEFRNLVITGVGTGIAMPGLPGTVPAGLVADGNRWRDVTIAAVHGLALAVGSNNALENVVVTAGNSAAAGESPTGLVLDFGSLQQGWEVRNVVVAPSWAAVQPKLTPATSGGAVTSVTVGPEHGLGFEAYGPTVPLSFSGSCSAAANVAVNGDGSLGTVTVTSGGVGCSASTVATVNVAGTWLAGRPVNLVTGQNMSFAAGNLLKGTGGYTVWNAAGSRAVGTQAGGGGTLTASTSGYPALVIGAAAGSMSAKYTGSANRFEGLGLVAGQVLDGGLGNTVSEPSASGVGQTGVEPQRGTAGTVSADFALLGGGSAAGAFTSLNDLFYSAEDLWAAGGESVGAGSVFAKDGTAPVTGSYVKAVGGAWDTTGNWNVRGASGGLLLGKGFPAGAGTWYVAAKADAAATQELKLLGTTGSVSCVFADQTVSLTTGWQVFAIPYNTVTGNGSCDSATSGNAVTAQGLTPSATTNVETAWVSFVPAFQRLLVANQPTSGNQAANKAYVDAQIASQIVSGAGALPITGGTMTGALNAPVINGTKNCALAGSVSGCVSGASSVLIPPGVTGSYAQNVSLGATAQCTYDPTLGGKITSVYPGQLGQGYTSAPAVVPTGGGGSGLTVAANVVGGQVTSYTISNGGSGYTSCPTFAVAAPPLSSAPSLVLDQRKGMTSYSGSVRVDDFGCAGDGVTDDTACFNNAISYATQNGTQAGAVTLSSGKSYYIGTITGYMQTAWDDGTAPSTDTCGGVACTNLAPETPGYLGYGVRIQSTVTQPLTIFGNGATIVSGFNLTAASAATYTLSAPYMAVFGSDQITNGWNLYDVTVSNAFVVAAVPSSAYWRWERVNLNGGGIALISGSSQYNEFRQIEMQGNSAGFVIGGWWGNRAPWTQPSGSTFLNSLDLGDGTVFDGLLYYGRSWPTGAQSQAAQNALDSWFNTYFFHLGDNATRLTDQNLALMGPASDSVWRGVYHVGVAVYSRFMRPVVEVTLHNVQVKETQNHPVIVTAPQGLTVDSMSLEGVGWCNGGSSFGAFGSATCPNPYDSTNYELPGAILLYQQQLTTVRNVQAGSGSSAVLEVVAEPWQVSSSQQLADFRQNMTETNSLSGSAVAVRSQPVPTSRVVVGPSNGALPAGVTGLDSGETCWKGANSGYLDEWCERAVEQTYGGGMGMPRYLAIENDGYSGFTGVTAVQMPGLRVRPGQMNATDGTLPVTDFAEQAFAIAGGSVNGESCATVPGIAVANAAAGDGVLFVKAPSAASPLQLGGTVTGANTMSLTVCNPGATAASYPAGTYYAFLLAGAAAGTSPAVSGGTPVMTQALTTTQGDLVVGDASGNPSRLAGNTGTAGAVLTQQGNGTTASAPVWQTAPAIYGGNITGLNASNLTTGTISVGNGGTGATTAAQALVNLGGASVAASATQFAGTLTAKQIGGLYQVDQYAGTDLGAKLAACVASLNAAYGGVCDARNFSGGLGISATLTLNVANATIYLPCGTISASNQVVVPAGVRNVTIHGCSLRGGSAASGSQGGTVLLYSGAGAAVQVGDTTYAVDTQGFHLDNVLVNTTNATTGTTTGISAYRTQEMDVESVYLLGNGNQTGVVLDGTGNYTGGTFYDVQVNGFQTGVSGIGHQVSNPATTDWMNASTFVRLHINCPVVGGSPVAGTVGINLAQGDGNTFDGGDVEGCATAVHLGANAVNNTLVGVRNENSTSQVVADTGSSYNQWITGGTMFTGQLTDNGSRNSFLDSFHRTFNGMKGDWYASQQDATVVNHYRLGTGAGKVRGLEWESQVDVGTTGSQYNWLWGLTDGASGQSNWVYQDLINNTMRLQMQENNGAGGNNQTAISGAGTGNVCFQCAANAGTGGVAFSSGGATPTTVATVDGSGNANFLGTLQVGGVTTHVGTVTVKNQADAEIDQVLWAGLTTAQKESLIYKDWNGNSQWYAVKDASNNWALNSAVGGLDSFKAYQSTNSGDTYVNAANGTGHVRINYETGAGAETDIYSGGSGSLVAAFLGATSIKLPGLAATSGYNCVQIDSSGYLTNTGATCGTGNGTITSFAAPAGSWPSWLVPTVTTATSTPSLAVAASAIPNSALANAGLTLGSTGLTLGGTTTSVTGLSVDGVSAATMAYLDLTSSVQTQLNGKAAAGAATTVNGQSCALGGSCTIAVGVGTVNAGTSGQVAYYAGAGSAVSGLGVTGTGNAVLATSPSISTPTISSPSISGPTVTGTLAGASETLSGTLAVTGTTTLTGATTHVGNVTVANGAASEADVVIQPGTGADQIGAYALSNYSGTVQWKLRKDASNYFRLTDAVNSMDRLILYQNGQTGINSGAGANAVVLNNTSGSGTGGLIVYEGGANYAVAALTVTGTGALTVPGTATANSFATTNGGIAVGQAGAVVTTNPNVATASACFAGGAYKTAGTYWTGSASATDTIALTPSCTVGTNGAETLTIANTGSTGAFTTVVSGNLQASTHAGTGTMTLAAGAAAGTSPTIACAASHTCNGVDGTVTLTTGTSPTTGTLATLTFPAAHTNFANCDVHVLSSTAQIVTVTWSESASAVTLTANAALTASTAYTVKYWCGGN